MYTLKKNVSNIDKNENTNKQATTSTSTGTLKDNEKKSAIPTPINPNKSNTLENKPNPLVIEEALKRKKEELKQKQLEKQRRQAEIREMNNASVKRNRDLSKEKVLMPYEKQHHDSYVKREPHRVVSIETSQQFSEGFFSFVYSFKIIIQFNMHAS